MACLRCYFAATPVTDPEAALQRIQELTGIPLTNAHRKLVKKRCLTKRYGPAITDFRRAIDDCLNALNSTSDELHPIPTLNLQYFFKMKVRAVRVYRLRPFL